jgi:tetrathionate reductase subunit B
MKKTGPKYAMVIDASKCFNCKACIISCQLENGVSPLDSRNWVKEITEKQSGEYHFQPANCMQCDEPSCVAACPVPGATYKAKDGIVIIDQTRCINCGNCVSACPYGARYRHPVKKVADKCDFCLHRISKGLQPACVVTCPTKARIFGDLNDPRSEVSGLLEGGDLIRVINAKVDTKPNIYFIKGTRPITWPREPELPGGIRMPIAFWRQYRKG